MKTLSSISALSFGALVVSGCALPVPIQVASWALDGISYVMTEKSVTDHGLSVVAQKDCAVWRGVTEGQLCREWTEEGDTLLASVMGLTDSSTPPVGTGWEKVLAYSNLRALEPNQVKVQSHLVSQAKSDGVGYPSSIAVKTSNAKGMNRVMKSETIAKASQYVSMPSNDTDGNEKMLALSVKHLASARDSSIYPIAQEEPVQGIYFVIGSFRDYGNARGLAAKHGSLLPTLLTAKLKNTSVYRVVVGPVEPGQESTIHRRIATFGFQDTWAIRVKPGDWSLASDSIKQVQRTKINLELAKLPQ